MLDLVFHTDFLVKMFRWPLRYSGLYISSFTVPAHVLLVFSDLYMYFWHFHLYSEIIYILDLKFLCTLLLRFPMFRQRECQKQAFFGPSPENFFILPWKKNQHVIYCGNRNFQQILNMQLSFNITVVGKCFYALTPFSKCW